MRRSNVPLNRTTTLPPYSSAQQPDIDQLNEVAERARTGDIGSPTLENFVVATYDTLLPRAIKFYREFAFQGVVIPDNPAGPFGETFFSVPESRTLVLREIRFRAGGVAPAGAFALDPFGMPVIGASPFRFSVRINGSAVQEFADLAILPPLVDNHILPCFILASGGDVVSVTGFIDDAAASFTAAGVLSGDLLLSRGSDPILEPLSIDPVPVKG